MGWPSCQWLTIHSDGIRHAGRTYQIRTGDCFLFSSMYLQQSNQGPKLRGRGPS